MGRIQVAMSTHRYTMRLKWVRTNDSPATNWGHSSHYQIDCCGYVQSISNQWETSYSDTKMAMITKSGLEKSSIDTLDFSCIASLGMDAVPQVGVIVSLCGQSSTSCLSSCILQTSLASLVPRVPNNYLTAINDLVCLEMSGISFMTGGDFHKSRKRKTQTLN